MFISRPLPIVVLCLSAGLSGCTGVATPDWGHPGTAFEQRREAQVYDPYPENDLGPEVVGGRPRGFSKPPSDTSRLQNSSSWWRRFGQPTPVF